MKSATIASLLAAASLSAAPVAAAAQGAGPAADVYQPAGQWSVDYGDDYCRLARNFSDGTNTMALALERIQPGPEMRLLLVGPDLKTFRTAAEIGWHFTPGDPERKARATHSVTADGKQWYNLGQIMLEALPVIKVDVRDYSGQFPPPRPAAGPGASPSAAPPGFDRQKELSIAARLDGLVLDSGITAPVQIDTGPLGAPIGALQACADDLAKSWGLDPAKLKTEKSPAIPDGDGAGWLPQGLIQFTDLGKLIGGSNQVRLMVDATGKATSCAIHWATLDAATNDKICKALMDKAKFTPAKDASGQSMAGYWISSPMMMGPAVKGRFGR